MLSAQPLTFSYFIFYIFRFLNIKKYFSNYRLMVNRSCTESRKDIKKVSHPECIDTYFSRIDAKVYIKSQEAQQLDASFLFITFNPPPFLDIYHDDCQLEEYMMYEQWRWMKERFEKFIRVLAKHFDQFDIVPEQTERGVIHVHIIAHKRDPDFLDTDIKKILWMMFDISLNVKDKKQRDAISNNSVHIQPITDMRKVLDYLFNKDKKSYETLYNKKHNGDYIYTPMVLTQVPVINDFESESEYEELINAPVTSLILRKLNKNLKK